jgi:hypothetical protein
MKLNTGLGHYLHINVTYETISGINPFTAEVAIMQLLGSAPKSHEVAFVRPEKEEQSDWLV